MQVALPDLSASAGMIWYARINIVALTETSKDGTQADASAIQSYDRSVAYSLFPHRGSNRFSKDEMGTRTLAINSRCEQCCPGHFVQFDRHIPSVRKLRWECSNRYQCHHSMDAGSSIVVSYIGRATLPVVTVLPFPSLSLLDFNKNLIYHI